MERLSANFFFDDYIARAGSPETAASLLLAELRQTPEACRKEVFFTAGKEYHFYAEHAQGFHWHISNHEQGVARRCAILMEGLKNVTLRGHGARLLMHGCLVAFDAPLFYAHSARKVVFRENAVVPSDAYLPWHPNRRSVTLLGVAENEVEN